MNDDKDRKNGKNARFLAAIGILTLVIVAGGIYLGYGLAKQAQSRSVSLQWSAETEMFADTAEAKLSFAEPAGTEESSARAMVLDVSDVVRRVMPSVVAITNKSVQEVTYMFRGTMEVESESSGSGIIIGQTEDELLIATNYHVVEDATTLTVCFTVNAENEEDAIVPAVVKGSDEQYDLSVIAVTMEDIPEDVLAQITVAEFGSSADLSVGEPAIAIGNALGYGQSVTLGIVSALDRTIEVDGSAYTYIQTDAAINFGNSGGALLNADGEVIGINSAKAASSGVEGMGYAIPIDEAEPILAVLMDRETREKLDRSECGYLGVYVQNVSAEARNLYEIPNGVFVSQVTSGSPAEEAGLQKGDIISRMDGLSVTSADRFEELQEYYRAGETISLEILRANKGIYVSQTLQITFAERPDQSESGWDGVFFGNRGPYREIE